MSENTLSVKLTELLISTKLKLKDYDLVDLVYFIENYGLKCLNPGGLLIIEDCNLDSFQNMSAPYNYEFFGYKGLENLGYPDNMFIIRKLGYE